MDVLLGGVQVKRGTDPAGADADTDTGRLKAPRGTGRVTGHLDRHDGTVARWQVQAAEKAVGQADVVDWTKSMPIVSSSSRAGAAPT